MRNAAQLLLMALLIYCAACNKEKASPEELAIGSYLADSTARIARGNYNGIELGYRFYASRPGRIIRMGTRMPAGGSYSVSLWDGDTKILLTQKMVEQAEPGVPKLESIPPLAVVPNKKYVVSVHFGASQPAYLVVSQDFSALLPFTKGSLTVANAQFRYGPTGFPANVDNGAIYGYPEVVFVAD